jgi:hypothetical protein
MMVHGLANPKLRKERKKKVWSEMKNMQTTREI